MSSVTRWCRGSSRPTRPTETGTGHARRSRPGRGDPGAGPPDPTRIPPSGTEVAMSSRSPDPPGRSNGGVRLERWRALLVRFKESLYDSRAAWVVLFLVCATPLVLVRRLQPEPPVLAPGAIASDDIVAPESRVFVAGHGTREVREAARAAVRPIFDLDDRAASDVIPSVQATIDAWRAPRAGRATAGGGQTEEAVGSPAARRARDYLVSRGFDKGV